MNSRPVTFSFNDALRNSLLHILTKPEIIIT